MNQLPENSLCTYDVTLVTSYLIGLWLVVLTIGLEVDRLLIYLEYLSFCSLLILYCNRHKSLEIHDC